MLGKFLQRIKYKMMARQLRKPSGNVGKIVGERMNKANEFLYDFTFGVMRISWDESILEIGFGNGKFFQKLSERAEGLTLSGIDYSPVMVEAARQLNADLLTGGKLTLAEGSSDALPFPSDEFHKIFCINVIYFWDDPGAHLREIYRVLKPGGRFYATIRTRETVQQLPFHKYGFTTYTQDEWASVANKFSLHLVEAVMTDEPGGEFDGKSFTAQSMCLVVEKPVL